MHTVFSPSHGFGEFLFRARPLLRPMQCLAEDTMVERRAGRECGRRLREAGASQLGGLDRVEALGEATDRSVSTLLRDDALGRGATDGALGVGVGLGGLVGVAGLEGLAAALHDRSHLRADVLVALAAGFGLADSLEGGLVIGQGGLSLIVGGAS